MLAAHLIAIRDATVISPQDDCLPAQVALECDMPALSRRRSPERRQQKIILGEMRASGVRGLLIFCSDYQYSHWTRLSADRWPDQVRLSDVEGTFVCKACGRRGADVQPDWQSASANRKGDRPCLALP